MYCGVFQDWITIRSGTTGQTVTQSEVTWADLSSFQDIVAWLDVKEFSSSTGNVQLAYQTAPAKDDTLFVAITSLIALSSNVVTVTPMVKDTITTPLSRWLRYQLSSTGNAPWEVTFRILLAANSPGLRLQGSGQ